MLGLGAFGGESVVGLTHNLFLDIIANFGYLYGIVLIAATVVKSIRNILLEGNSSYGLLLMVFFSMVFPIATFSGSFWGTKELWILFALVQYYDKLLINAKLKRQKKWKIAT